MGVRAGVDGAPYLGHPELDAVMSEDGEGEAELIAVERPGGLAHDDRLESAVGPGQGFEEGGCHWTALPGQRAGAAYVEVLGHHDSAGRLDEAPRPGELPVLGRLGVLLVLGGHTTVEGEPLPTLS